MESLNLPVRLLFVYNNALLGTDHWRGMFARMLEDDD